MKDLMIVSCERAGTHFLIDSIIWNFPKFNKKRIDIPANGEQKKFEKFLKKYEPSGHNIIKSHHQFEFFEPIIDIVKEKFNIIYIMREGKDSMVSWHYYFNDANSCEFPFSKTVTDLMMKNPTNYSFDNAYSKIKSENMIQRWETHVISWVMNAKKASALIITYDDLYIYFSKIINRISEFIDESPVHKKTRPLLFNGSGIFPRKGIIGDWLNHFTSLDENYFYSHINSTILYNEIWDKEARLTIIHTPNKEE